MSNTINGTVNLYVSGQQQSINSSSQVVNIFPAQDVNQTGTLGVVSPSNPDGIFMTGIFIVNINTTLPVYKDSLLVATMTIAGSESTIYDRPELNRSPFAFVNGIQMMEDLIDNPAAGADIPQVGDYVVFVQDDLPYLEGDRGAWNGSSWIKFGPGEPIDISIVPTNPLAEIPVAVKTQSTSDAELFATYADFATVAKNTGVFVNFNTNGVNAIDITSVLKPVTESSAWKKNNGVNIIIEPTGVARLSEPPFTTVSSIAEMEALPTELPPNREILESTAEVQTGNDVPLTGIIPVTDDFVVVDDRATIRVAQGSDIWMDDENIVVTPRNVLRTSNGVVTGVIVTRDVPYFGVSSLSGIVTKQIDIDTNIVLAGDYVYFTEDDFPYNVGDKG